MSKHLTKNQETTACKYCGEQTSMLGTKLCDPCWELGWRIEAAPELALEILTKLNKTPLPPRRPATKIEIEAMQSKDELEEARKIIRALLGAPPPRTWRKWPNIHKRATKFLKQHK
jgi:hypothetical protein